VAQIENTVKKQWVIITGTQIEKGTTAASKGTVFTFIDLSDEK